MSLQTPPQQKQKPEAGTEEKESVTPLSGPEEEGGVMKKRVIGIKEPDERDLMWKVNVSNTLGRVHFDVRIDHYCGAAATVAWAWVFPRGF